jgi:hypothetical protein
MPPCTCRLPIKNDEEKTEKRKRKYVEYSHGSEKPCCSSVDISSASELLCFISREVSAQRARCARVLDFTLPTYTRATHDRRTCTNVPRVVHLYASMQNSRKKVAHHTATCRWQRSFPTCGKQEQRRPADLAERRGKPQNRRCSNLCGIPLR